jgi:protein-tyrosine phosphatase
MDTRNYEDAIAHCPEEYREKVHYFLDFASDVSEREVPDPYYGGAHGFEHVLDLIEAASVGLLGDIGLRYESALTALKLKPFCG